MAAPEQEHDGIGPGGDGGHGGVGEGFPALVLVRTGLAGLDRQRIVEQEHALLRPVDEMAMGGPGQAEVGAQFLENVDEAGRHLDAALNRKREAVGLSGAMIGVLPEDHDLDLRQRGQFERGQALAARGIDGLARGFLGLEEAAQRAQRGLARTGSRAGAQLAGTGEEVIAGAYHAGAPPHHRSCRSSDLFQAGWGFRLDER
jgi:hypothetical protein